VLPLSSRTPLKGEKGGSPLTFISTEVLVEEVAQGAALGQCEHAGALYAVRAADLQAAWDEGRMPVIEAPLALLPALRTQAPDVDVIGVYLTADIETLDVRMRAVAKLEEVQLQAELEMAVHEMQYVKDAKAAAAEAEAKAIAEAEAAAAKAATAPPPPKSPKTPPPGSKSSTPVPVVKAPPSPVVIPRVDVNVPDHIIPTKADVLQVYHCVKEVAAMQWHRPRAPVACQVVVEEFDWQAPQPGPTRMRLRTLMANTGMLELGRGTHLLRVAANLEYLHALTFMSNTDIEANEYTQALPLYEEGVNAVNLEGEHAALSASSTNLLFRYNLAVAEPTKFVASLAVSREEVRTATRLVLVDNATGQEHMLGLPRLSAMELQPNGKGYSLLAIASIPAGRPPAEEGSWALTLTSSSPPQSLDPVSCTRVQTLEGTYQANSKRVLARQLMVPTAPTQVAVVVTTQPPVPFKLQVVKVPAGQEVHWGEAYPVVVERHAPQGATTLHNLALPAGKYVVHMELDAEGGSEGLQPHPVTGEVDTPISWKMIYLPSTDDKICPITADDSKQRYFRTMVDQWGGGAAGAKAGAKPAAGAAGGKAPAAGGGARAQQAAAVLEKYKAELKAAAAGTGTAAARTLKDGSSVQLDPPSRMAVVPPPAGQLPVLLADEALAERQAQQEATASEGSDVAKGVSSTLEQDKSRRAALAARKASEFSAWRNSRVLGAKDAIKARADALAKVREEEAAAAAAAAAEAEAMAAAAAAAAAGGDAPRSDQHSAK